ncbi:MAG: 50S ribosomal protein L10 [Actinobacteria bacterium BACL15 MAG-120619-bin91]|jgi:large subunit ribosomal protein L10|uniref:Large ribosomal subunit protein uL10 n=2 Tax=ac1 cluster TaxID=1655545 RepID=A0A0R2PGI1_9ACTN|nr:MAG: 50S ribosomal protein L10 [Actinobacteria bacterium BACL15 MAG-120619-bin91]KRO37092.1 MAG: 50S ribosomal protein L10 [Actinobacteria bacterium BACL15 MAG-120823-bin78]
MARPDKTSAVAELAEDFRTANATVLTEYRGLSVTSMKELRRALGSTTKYSVVKNTLTKIAAKDAGVEIADDLLVGPSAVAFIKGDPIDAAKSLRDFAKENPFLVIKGGIYEGKSVTPAEIMQLANLESREVLLAKLAGAMKGSLAKAARIFDALRIKLEAEQGVSEPAANNAVAEVSAPAATADSVVVTEEATPEVVAEVAEVPAAEATEASTETEEKE